MDLLEILGGDQIRKIESLSRDDRDSLRESIDAWLRRTIPKPADRYAYSSRTSGDVFEIRRTSDAEIDRRRQAIMDELKAWPRPFREGIAIPVSWELTPSDEEFEERERRRGYGLEFYELNRADGAPDGRHVRKVARMLDSLVSAVNDLRAARREGKSEPILHRRRNAVEAWKLEIMQFLFRHAMRKLDTAALRAIPIDRARNRLANSGECAAFARRKVDSIEKRIAAGVFSNGPRRGAAFSEDYRRRLSLDLSRAMDDLRFWESAAAESAAEIERAAIGAHTKGAKRAAA